MIDIGKSNEFVRVEWIKNVLKKVPNHARILDAGAGEQQFKKYCSHLNYVSQDFAKYEGQGDGVGLQTGSWNHGELSIISDITSIPEPDSSFDAIMCTEVFEHLTDPIAAINEFSRLLKSGGLLILTAPFCSITHFSPYHYYTGFNRYFYEYHLPKSKFEILEINQNGNFFEYLAQEVLRLNTVTEKYAGRRLNFLEKINLFFMLKMLERISTKDQGSKELLCFGYHILARRK